VHGTRRARVSPTTIGLFVFVCTFSGALLGLLLRGFLPSHHLGNEARDTVKLGIGLVATITALILGLVTASAKEAFDSADRALKDAAANVLSLDRVLARYGSETAAIRAALKRTVAERVDLIWTKRSRSQPFDLAGSTHEIELLPANIRRLEPRNDDQHGLRARALDLTETMMRSRWHVSVGLGTAIRPQFVAVLLFWLTVTFASFGMLGERNVTVVCVLLVCAISVAGAVFLVLELDGPFDGLITVSPEPLKYAIAHLGE
jgi:hypothetical protein